MEEKLQFKGKILVADDEKVNIDFFQVMLARLGFTVEVASDGKEVLEKVDTFMPDLILLDLLMPNLSGFEVAKILKKNEKTKDIPIIVLSAVRDIREKVDMFEVGIEDYITKPFNFIEILARIRNILRTKELKANAKIVNKRVSLLEELVVAIRPFLNAIGDELDGIRRVLNTTESSTTLVDEELLKIVLKCIGSLSEKVDDFKSYYFETLEQYNRLGKDRSKK